MLTQRIYETMDRKTHVNFFLEINQRSSSKFDFVITLIRLTAKLYIYLTLLGISSICIRLTLYVSIITYLTSREILRVDLYFSDHYENSVVIYSHVSLILLDRSAKTLSENSNGANTMCRRETWSSSQSVDPGTSKLLVSPASFRSWLRCKRISDKISSDKAIGIHKERGRHGRFAGLRGRVFSRSRQF